jgi:hypothetical protein
MCGEQLCLKFLTTSLDVIAISEANELVLLVEEDVSCALSNRT